MARSLELILRSRPETTDAGAIARRVHEVLRATRRPSRTPPGLAKADTDQLDLDEPTRLSIPDDEAPPRS